MKNRTNPGSYLVEFRWSPDDMDVIHDVVALCRQFENPLRVVQLLAARNMRAYRGMPYLRLVAGEPADGQSPERTLAWFTLVYTKALEEKKAEAAVAKLCRTRDAEKCLYAALRYLSLGHFAQMMDVPAILEDRTHAGITRKRQLVEEALKQGVDCPDYEAVQFLVLNVQDVLQGAAQELERNMP